MSSSIFSSAGRTGSLCLGFLIALAYAGLSVAVVQADIIVDVQDTTITADGTGFVNVLISSNAAPGTPDNVDFASYDFGITSVGAPGSSLRFVYPPDLSEGTIGGANGYLFFGDTAGIAYDAINSTPSNYLGSDGTNSFAGVDLSTTTSRLLVRLELQHDLGPGQTTALADGEQFRITLQNSFDTFFDDFNVDPVGIDASSFDALGVGGGLITVSGSAAAVPEPSSLLLLGFGVVGFAVQRRRIAMRQS